MTRAQATDEQLRDIARYLARLCLEVERGMRPPDHLARFLDPPTRRRWQPRTKIGRFAGGPVRPRDIGIPQVSRPTDLHAFISVATNTEAGRWGALSFEMRCRSGRWHVTDIQRLLAATHYRSTPRIASERGPDRPLGSVSEERRLAGAALRASERRLDELAPNQPGYRQTSQLARTWRRMVADLDREIADIRLVRDARKSLSHALRR